MLTEGHQTRAEVDDRSTPNDANEYLAVSGQRQQRVPEALSKPMGAAEIVRVRGTGIEELAGHERQYAKRAVDQVAQVDEYLARIHGLGLPR